MIKFQNVSTFNLLIEAESQPGVTMPALDHHLRAAGYIPVEESVVSCGKAASDTAEHFLARLWTALDRSGNDGTLDEALVLVERRVHSEVTRGWRRAVENALGTKHNITHRPEWAEAAIKQMAQNVEALVNAGWRSMIEEALGIEFDPENHTLAWARETIEKVREIGNQQTAKREEFEALERELHTVRDRSSNPMSHRDISARMREISREAPGRGPEVLRLCVSLCRLVSEAGLTVPSQVSESVGAPGSSPAGTGRQSSTTGERQELEALRNSWELVRSLGARSELLAATITAILDAAQLGDQQGVLEAYTRGTRKPQGEREELEALQQVVGRIRQWSIEYGCALQPSGPDSFGEGVRDCKRQVADILSAVPVRQAERGPWPSEGTWSVFAEKVVAERDALQAQVAELDVLLNNATRLAQDEADAKESWKRRAEAAESVGDRNHAEALATIDRNKNSIGHEQTLKLENNALRRQVKNLKQRLVDQLASTDALQAEIERLTKLAYLGDHHFPDLTYKARLDELVPQHRELERQVERLSQRLAGIPACRPHLFVGRPARCTRCGEDEGIEIRNLRTEAKVAKEQLERERQLYRAEIEDFDAVRHRVLRAVGEDDNGKSWAWIESRLIALRQEECRAHDNVLSIERLQDAVKHEKAKLKAIDCLAHATEPVLLSKDQYGWSTTYAKVLELWQAAKGRQDTHVHDTATCGGDGVCRRCENG